MSFISLGPELEAQRYWLGQMLVCSWVISSHIPYTPLSLSTHVLLLPSRDIWELASTATSVPMIKEHKTENYTFVLFKRAFRGKEL